jgi:hypothetical protein
MKELKKKSPRMLRPPHSETRTHVPSVRWAEWKYWPRYICMSAGPPAGQGTPPLHACQQSKAKQYWLSPPRFPRLLCNRPAVTMCQDPNRCPCACLGGTEHRTYGQDSRREASFRCPRGTELPAAIPGRCQAALPVSPCCRVAAGRIVGQVDDSES